LYGCIHVCASDAFSESNLNRNRQQNLEAMRKQTRAHLSAGVSVNKISVMAAFGCNFAGDIKPASTVAAVEDAMAIAAEFDATILEIALADTMGWSTPTLTERVVAEVRSRWPTIPIRLHLHDTRGLGIANASRALSLGVERYDTTVGGLGGCPFAKHKGAAGNIATEELVLLAEESGISTGIDIHAMIAAGHLAESIIGRTLPSAVLRGGSLESFRTNARANRV
ncbi:MAG: hydroxymethylglutaryl-CoA lyase, partial [Pseudomonadales bacterium]